MRQLFENNGGRAWYWSDFGSPSVTQVKVKVKKEKLSLNLSLNLSLKGGMPSEHEAEIPCPSSN